MGKFHLTNEDVKLLINTLKNYDCKVTECLKVDTKLNPTKDEINDAIDTHNEIEHLIRTLLEK